MVVDIMLNIMLFFVLKVKELGYVLDVIVYVVVNVNINVE